MNRYLLATPLAAGLLLLSTLGCSKKEDAKPAYNIGSYKLDGVSRNCVITRTDVTRSQYTGSGWEYIDAVEVRLTTTPRPQFGDEAVDVFFAKRKGEPASAYQLQNIIMFEPNNATGKLLLFGTNASMTVADATGGGLSGTFAGTSMLTATAVDHVITDGIFTDARP